MPLSPVDQDHSTTPAESSAEIVAGKLIALFGGADAAFNHSVAWAFTDGTSFVMDLSKDEPIVSGFSRECDLTIVTNSDTMQALFDGSLDLEAPKPGQLFVWGGEVAALDELRKALVGFSPVDLRADG